MCLKALKTVRSMLKFEIIDTFLKFETSLQFFPYLGPILSLSCNLPVNVTSDLVLCHTHLSATNFNKNVNRIGLYLTVWIVMSHLHKYDWKHQIYLFGICKLSEVHHTFIIYLCHPYSRPILSPGHRKLRQKFNGIPG